jgi:taurine dioxygenase
MASAAKSVRPGAIDLTPLSGALGARIDGVDLGAPLGEATMARIKDAFLEYSVLVFSGQDKLTPAQQVAFAARWGEVHLMPTPEKCLDGNRAVLVLDTYGERPVTDAWHSDVTMEETPPLGSFLLARTVPVGGDTIFASQYLAYEALSDGMKRLLNGLFAVHNGDNFAAAGNYDPATFPSSVHPVVRTHPETGRKALFVNPVYTSRFEGMTAAESRPLLDYLCAHAVQPNFTFRHHWTRGDLLMWDNRCLQHFAVADYGSSPRTMHRVTVLGDRPF